MKLPLCPPAILAAALVWALAATPAALAGTPAPSGGGMPSRAPEMDGPAGPGERRPGPPAWHGLAPGLTAGVVLDEAQEDKVFAILHAQEPQRREQSRILRQSRDALRAMASSGQYDEGKAALLARSAGAAVAALELMEARTGARIMALMTPEQRSEAQAGKARRQPRFDR